MSGADGISAIPPEVPYLEFREPCGAGGMAVVWRAWHRIIKRDVAVKVLNSELEASPQDVEHFITEARVLEYLHHPCIVRGYGAQVSGDGRHFYLMDFIGGYTLAAFQARKVRVPEVDVLLVIQCVASALGYAWDSFRTVHCDLKPENLMVDTDGTVKITDMGLASETLWDESRRVRLQEASDKLEGTPAFMSPEQIYGDMELDCRTDIYSMGSAAYQLVTGRHLFPGMTAENTVIAHVDAETAAPDPRLFVPELSAPFVRLLSRMLVKDRDHRFRDWGEVAAACAEVEAGRCVAPADAPSSMRENP